MNELKVKNNSDYSLLPYLNALHKKVYLKFPLISQDITIIEKTPFPFLVITDSDPLARLIEGQFVTDAGSELKKVFILVQRDEYLLTKDELWPINNQDVDNSWQKAFSFYAEKQDRSLMILSNQINENGKLMLLSSLFFCKTRQLFFHPPCPNCGLLLQQCEDDDLLIRSGLQPYSTSLKRYLFCPSCGSSGNYDFYIYELDPFDPPTLKDRWTLLKEFGLLREGRKEVGKLPCDGCPDHQECYGADHRVLARIVPFSFYPFYILIFEAMSLNALDFLSLISGATFEELGAKLETRGELGRINCLNAIKQNGLVKSPFFYDRDARYFLEVLYLKLSFLGEVLQNLFSGNNLFRHPDLRLSIDRIWVRLADHGGLLPFFWNFRVKSIDISRPFVESQTSSKLPPSSDLYFLGLVWFYALLVNKKQDISKVLLSLKEAVSNSFSTGDFSSDKLFKEEVNPVFLPLNIFWDTEGKKFSHNWHRLWGKSLSLGWSLFKASFQYDPKWLKEEFWQQLQNVREEVKSNLFQKEPMDFRQAYSSEQVHQLELENEAVHNILVKIMNKWRLRVEAVEEEETIILPSQGLKEKTSPLQEKEELQETVILSPEGLKEKASPPSLQEKEVTEVVPETVIISPPGIDKYSSDSLPGEQAQDLGQEEKMISPKEVEKLELTKKRIKKPEDEDFLAETVILGPQKVREKSKKEKDD